MRKGFLAIGAALLLGGVAGAAESKLSEQDRRFIEKAAEGGLAEVQLGKLAQQKGQSEAVKEFGRRMVEDHGKANQELKQIAAQKGVNVPQQLAPEAQRELDRLSRLSGAEFDRAYLDSMVKDHDKDLTEFKREAEQSNDPELKKFASRTASVVETHDDLAHKDLQKM